VNPQNLKIHVSLKNLNKQLWNEYIESEFSKYD